MKRKILDLLSVACLMSGSAGAQNLLLNGNFNLPGDGSSATDWTAWAYNGGWANTETDTWTYDGSYQLTAGGAGNSGGGSYQIVSATAGQSYNLSVESGADAWWLPTGTMTMFFLDATNGQVGLATRTTVDPAVYGMNYDIPHPWQNYSLSAIAPAGTTQIKVEFACNETSDPNYTYGATGSVGFDNAVLTVQAVPEPGMVALSILGGILLMVGYRSRRDTIRG